MRKVWITKRDAIPGCYVEWYDDSGRRRSKYFGPAYQKYVNAFKTRKFAELNADIRQIGSVIDVPWTEARSQYLKQKTLEGLAAGSITEITQTIKLFESHCTAGTAAINQTTINNFIESLQSRQSTHIDREQSDKKTKVRLKLSPNTINKYLRNLRSMLRWMESKRYIAAGLTAKNVKSDQKAIRTLNNAEIHNLIAACGDDKQWRMRILMAVCTGLRRSDLDKLKIKDVDIERKLIGCGISKKTGKAVNHQPLPDSLMPIIEQFILEEVADGQVRFFKGKFSKKWEAIRHRAGLDDIDFHDLRRTFGSLQADAGTPIKALQEMYQHSNIETTMRHYIKAGDSEKRVGVNSLKIEKWL